MGNWTLQKKSGGSYVSYPISNVNISLSLSGINIANITTHIDDSGTKINVNDEVIVSYDSNIVFIGFVDTSSQSNKTTYQLTISEKANELQNIYVYKNGSYRVPVDNTDEDVTFVQYISTILNTGVVGHDSGWVDGGNTNVKTSLTIPSTSTHYPSVLFSYSNCYEGLTHMIDDVANVKFRFDYDYTTGIKTLRYGTISSPSDTYTLSTNVVDITNIVITTLDDEDVYDYGLDKVIVVKSGDGSVVGSATVASPSSPPKTVVYQYDNVTDNNEATAMAQAILNQRSASNVIKSVYLPTGFFGVQEGDYVQIGESYYAVTKIQYSINETVIDLNGIYLDVWQQYSQKKRVTSTGVFEGVESTWDGGKRNLYASEGVEYNYYCGDISKIGDNFELTVDYDLWDSEISVNNKSMLNSSNTNYTGLTSTQSASVVVAVTGNTYGSLNIEEEDYDTTVVALGASQAKDIFNGAPMGTDGWNYWTADLYKSPGVIFVDVNLSLDAAFTSINGYADVYCAVFVNDVSGLSSPSWSDLHHVRRQRIYADKLSVSQTQAIQKYNLTFNVRSTCAVEDRNYIRIGIYYGMSNYCTGIQKTYATVNTNILDGHSHTVLGVDQYHGILDATHDHNVASTHDHTTTSGLTYVGTGCSSPGIVVTNGNGVSTSFSLSGSGVVSIPVNIRSALSTGTNKIKVNSLSDCSATLRATYISY